MLCCGWRPWRPARAIPPTACSSHPNGGPRSVAIQVLSPAPENSSGNCALKPGPGLYDQGLSPTSCKAAPRTRSPKNPLQVCPPPSSAPPESRHLQRLEEKLLLLKKPNSREPSGFHE